MAALPRYLQLIRDCRSTAIYDRLQYSIMLFYLGLTMHPWLVMGIKKNISVLVPLFIMVFASCKTDERQTNVLASANIDSVVRRMSDIMVHDVTNPPLAARFFYYAFLSGYEIVSQNNPSVKSMQGTLNSYPSISKPAIKTFDYQLAALLAIIETAGSIQPSGKQLESLEEKILRQA